MAAWLVMAAGAAAYLLSNFHAFMWLTEEPVLLLLLVLIQGIFMAPPVVMAWRADAFHPNPRPVFRYPASWLVVAGALPLFLLPVAIKSVPPLIVLGAVMLSLLPLTFLSMCSRASRNQQDWPKYRRRMRMLLHGLMLVWIPMFVVNHRYLDVAVFTPPNYWRSIPIEVRNWMALANYAHLVIVPNLVMCLFFLGLGLMRAATDTSVATPKLTSPVKSNTPAKAGSLPDAPPAIPEWAVYPLKGRA
jgi:hypothetical protein